MSESKLQSEVQKRDDDGRAQEMATKLKLSAKIKCVSILVTVRNKKKNEKRRKKIGNNLRSD